ncbi:MAG: NAD-dependent epimerase/dehydratase family protein [Gemmataceae bacterium]
MNILVAGASGAIGRPLLAELIRQGHAVTGMTHSEAGARIIASVGVAVAQVSAFDAPALERALRESRAEVVIDELTFREPHGNDRCIRCIIGPSRQLRRVLYHASGTDDDKRPRADRLQSLAIKGAHVHQRPVALEQARGLTARHRLAIAQNPHFIQVEAG